MLSANLFKCVESISVTHSSELIVAKMLIQWKGLLFPVLMIAFLGQALAASALPCAMMDSSPDQHQMTDHAMDHSTHQIDEQVDPHQSDTPPSTMCCDGPGFCSMLNCLSVAALPTAIYSAGSPTPEIPIAAALISTPHHSPDTLYRPPIFA